MTEEIIIENAFHLCQRLEQENKELKDKTYFRLKEEYLSELQRLKQENENIINEYNKLQAEIIGDIEFKELILTGITPLKVLQNLKQRNRELQAFYDVHESFKADFDTNRKLLDKYRSALEEISGLASPHCTQCSQIINIINEVLK